MMLNEKELKLCRARLTNDLNEIDDLIKDFQNDNDYETVKGLEAEKDAIEKLLLEISKKEVN